MLSLKNITKTYFSADEKVEALKGVNLNFRANEFVSILGPSGCGKTTLLNIIGGLDKYTGGDLVIGGKSTRDFSDHDWDTYRNHSIGFVFQSYNLIPHQTVLSNVELALTLSGVSKTERRKRAIEALDKVGLHDQIKKKPNQMSGGQMQRVAIARALVNDPEILLADEPTGALDSATSIQIMDLLKEIAKEKLVIMVTHNPELAKQYSNRIIRLLDGRITDDTAPFDGKERIEKPKETSKKKNKTSMSFFTALSLSLNNLMTKKGRTVLTAFAGSIGIIGIALILSLSNGINSYINRVQEDTLSSYPITIQAESVDMTAMLSTLMGINHDENSKHDLDAVYASDVMVELMNSVVNPTTEVNNLTLFKEFLDDNGENIQDYISNIQYAYQLDLNIFTKDSNGTIVRSDVAELIKTLYSQMGVSTEYMTDTTMQSFSSMKLWQEMLAGENGEIISPLLQEQYELIYGSWPENYSEVVLLVDENNELSDLVLYALGLRPIDDMVEQFKTVSAGKEAEAGQKSWSYEDICNKEFRIIPSYAMYQKNPDGSYSEIGDIEKGIDYLYSSNVGTTLKIRGIIRTNPGSISGSLSGAIGYTSALTEFLIQKGQDSEIVKAQLADPETDIIKALPFKTGNEEQFTAEEKIAMIREYLTGLNEEKKAEIYADILATPSDEYVQQAVESAMADQTRETIKTSILTPYIESNADKDTLDMIESSIDNMSDEELFASVRESIEAQVRQTYHETASAQISQRGETALASEFTLLLQTDAAFTNEQYLSFYDSYMPETVSDATLDQNLRKLGYIDKKNPSSISIYAKSFEDKDKIADAIARYNETKEKDDQISYTDYVALLMSSISTIINAISYVLIAFVAVSLVVSSIMIGIITYISVLERTKEIGILRAIGASKSDISRVFNAETLIEGFVAGAIGIGLTLLLTIPINLIIHALTDIPSLSATLPPVGAIILVVISMLLTFIAGLIPSGVAAKKDPVVALRSE